MKLNAFTLSAFLICSGLLWASCGKKPADDPFGGKWKQLTTPNTQPILSMYFSSRDTGYAVCGYVYDEKTSTTKSTYLVTYDGGENWRLETTSIKNLVAKNIYACQSALYLMGNLTKVGAAEGLYRSMDKGKTWTLLDSTHFIRNLQLLTPAKGFFTYSQNIYITTDSGKHFTSTAHVDIGGFGDAQIINNHLIYVQGFDKMYKSADGGSSWSPFANMYSPSVVNKMQFIDANLGYIFVDDGQDGFAGPITPHNNKLVKTTDGGSTWSVVRDDLLQYGYFEGACFVSATQGYLATDKGIFATNDGGNSWQQEFEATQIAGASSISGLYFTPGGVGFAYGRTGIIKQVK